MYLYISVQNEPKRPIDIVHDLTSHFIFALCKKQYVCAAAKAKGGLKHRKQHNAALASKLYEKEGRMADVMNVINWHFRFSFTVLTCHHNPVTTVCKLDLLIGYQSLHIQMCQSALFFLNKCPCVCVFVWDVCFCIDWIWQGRFSRVSSFSDPKRSG